MALFDGEMAFDTVVALRYPDRVVSPCGMCRELFCEYDPSTQAIMPAPGGELGKLEVSELLPGKHAPR